MATSSGARSGARSRWYRDLARTADDLDGEEREVVRRNAAALRARGNALWRRAAAARRGNGDRDPARAD